MPKNKNYKPEDRTPPKRNNGKNPVKGKTAAEMDADYAKAKKKLKIVAPICIVIIVVAFIFTKRPVPPELILPQHTYAAFYSEQTNSTTFIVDGKLLNSIDGEAEIVYTQLDGTSAFAASSDGTAYVLTADGMRSGVTPPSAAPDYSELIAGIPDINETAPLVTNSDGTQVLVQTEFGAYICRADAEPIQIGGDGLNYPFDLWQNSQKNGDIVTYRGSKLFEIAYINEHNGKFALYGVGDDGTSARYGPLSDVPLLMRSNNGSAYYVKDGTIYLMQNSTNEVGNNELEENIVPGSLCIDAARKRLYFINNGGELRTLKGKGSSRVVDFNVSVVKSAQDKGVYYLTADGGLNSYDGKSSKLIAENVTEFSVLPKMLLYTDGDGGTWAMSADGTTTTFIGFIGAE